MTITAGEVIVSQPIGRESWNIGGWKDIAASMGNADPGNSAGILPPMQFSTGSKDVTSGAAGSSSVT